VPDEDHNKDTKPMTHRCHLPAGPLPAPRPSAFNIGTSRIGGIRFIKIGLFCFSFCVTHAYRPLPPTI
jgi:hypothetical protein